MKLDQNEPNILAVVEKRATYKTRLNFHFVNAITRLYFGAKMFHKDITKFLPGYVTLTKELLRVK